MKDNEQDDRKKITVFVDPELHKAASVKLAQKGGKPAGYSFQSVVTELLADWTGEKKEVQIQPEKVSSDRYREDLQRLLDVLEHGSASERDLIRSTIKHHAEALRGRDSKSEPKGMPPNPSPSSRSPRNQSRPAR